MSDTIQLVSEGEDSPSMPGEAWVAMMQIRMMRYALGILDKEGVPQDHVVRAKVVRQVLDLVGAKCERDLAELQVSRAKREAQAETHH